MSGHQHLSKLEADEAVGKAILQINSGGFKEAEATLASVLTKDPRNYQALVARGTCRALSGSSKPAELRKAEADFSRAIEVR